jgi:hypothetical protein
MATRKGDVCDDDIDGRRLGNGVEDAAADGLA